MTNWFLDNLVSIIMFVITAITYIISFVKLTEKFKNDIKRHDDEITRLEEELNKEKEQNKQNYIKQESKIEDCINNLSDKLAMEIRSVNEKFSETVQALSARMDKIDDIKSDITSMKKDIEYMKEDIKYLKDKVDEN